MLNKELFTQYSDLKVKIKELEEQLDELQPELIAQMQDEKADKVDTDAGTFTIVAKKKYTFSEAVLGLEVAVKELKAKETAEGTATYEESTYIVFKEKKPYEQPV